MSSSGKILDDTRNKEKHTISPWEHGKTEELLTNLNGNSQHHPFKVIRLYHFLTVAPLMSPCHT